MSCITSTNLKIPLGSPTETPRKALPGSVLTHLGQVLVLGLACTVVYNVHLCTSSLYTIHTLFYTTCTIVHSGSLYTIYITLYTTCIIVYSSSHVFTDKFSPEKSSLDNTFSFNIYHSCPLLSMEDWTKKPPRIPKSRCSCPLSV